MFFFRDFNAEFENDPVKLISIFFTRITLIIILEKQMKHIATKE